MFYLKMIKRNSSVFCLLMLAAFLSITGCVNLDVQYDKDEGKQNQTLHENEFKFEDELEDSFSKVFIVLDIAWVVFLIWIVFLGGSYWLEGNPFAILFSWEWARFNFSAKAIRITAAVSLFLTVIHNIMWFFGYLM